MKRVSKGAIPRKLTENEKFIRGISIPEVTKSYQPLSHGQQIDILLEEGKMNGFELVSDPHIQWCKRGQVYAGTFDFNHPDVKDKDMGIRVIEMNSYNKKHTAKIATGSNVFICCNGMLVGDFILARKHTPGNLKNNGVVADFKNMVTKALVRSLSSFEELVDEKNRMKSVQFDEQASAWLVDRLFFEEEIINATQFQFLKQEMYLSKNFAVGPKGLITLWDFYNNVTETLKSTRANLMADRHMELHEYTMNNLVDYKF